MAKIIFLMIVISLYLWGAEKVPPFALQNKCLACHTQQKIPSEAIYRRYLLKYSSKALIREKILAYLRKPSEKHSIMPPQFFSKFPLKEPSDLDEKQLAQLVDAYIDYFDIGKRLRVLPADN